MKFLTKTDLSNASKDIRHILSHELRNAIDELGEKYDFDDNTIESLSYSLYVNHNSKVQFKTGKTKFTKAYEKSVNKLIDEGKVSFEDMGFLLYLSTKFTNHEDNYLRLDDDFASKNDLINFMLNETNIGMSGNTLRRKFKSVEDKMLLMVDSHPNDKKKNTYYLTPLLFYKGKHMDISARKALISVYRGLYYELKELVDKGELDIEMETSFEKLSDEDILLIALEKVKC